MLLLGNVVPPTVEDLNHKILVEKAFQKYLPCYSRLICRKKFGKMMMKKKFPAIILTCNDVSFSETIGATILLSRCSQSQKKKYCVAAALLLEPRAAQSQIQAIERQPGGQKYVPPSDGAII